MLQIASGILRGIPLRSPRGEQTRPSSERLRQGIFNVLRHHRFGDEASILIGAQVADVFAGTGALGLEALSNGAVALTCIEKHPSTLKTLEENFAQVRHAFEAQALEIPEMRVLKKDVLQAYAKLPVVRVLFCDPPYEKGWFEKILKLEGQHDRIEPGGLFVFEAREKEQIPEFTGQLRHYDTKNYGDSSVHFFVKEKGEK